MRPPPIAVALLSLVVLSPAQQSNRKIVLQLLNGKNGKPIRDENINVWLGNVQSWPTADSQGEVMLDFSHAQPSEIRVMPNYRFDCRFKADAMGGRSVKYSLNEIITKGIVGENLCGKISALPRPGVLTLFVRPRTFFEKWKL